MIVERAARLGEGGEAVLIDQFVFKTAKGALDKGIVVAVSLSTHRSGQAMLG